jgi:hypothetical protein
MGWMHVVATVPLPAAVGIILVLCVLLPCLAIWAVRRIWPYPAFKENNEIVGFTYAVFGLIYGVLLAFTIIVAWEKFSETERNVVREVTTLSELWRDSEAFGVATSGPIHATLRAYAESVVRDEWPEMAARGREHTQTRKIYAQLWRQSYNLQPQGKLQEAYLAEYLRDLNELSATRRTRILYSRTEIHSILWLILFVGAVPIIAYSLLFANRHAWVQVVITAFIMLIVLLSLLVALSLQYPFTGEVSIGPEAFRALLESFHQRLLESGH